MGCFGGARQGWVMDGGVIGKKQRILLTSKKKEQGNICEIRRNIQQLFIERTNVIVRVVSLVCAPQHIYKFQKK